MLRGALVAAVLGLALPSAAQAYGWPVKPFDRMHAVRGSFDDPRFHLRPDLTAAASFHFGVDIPAPDGTPVYAVEPGLVVSGHDWVNVRRPNRRMFGYWHVRPAVKTGVHVRLHQLIGWVAPGWGHVHLAETVAGAYRNPLRPGALTPYRETNVPVVASISVVRLDGHALQAVQSASVSGTVGLIADAYEVPSIEPPPPWNVSRLVPSLVRWRLIPATGDPPGPWRVAADFRTRLLPANWFSRVYAPGTYQNKPNRPGDYRLWLTPSFDTTTLPNGTYYVDVEAESVRGVIGESSIALAVANP
ncbi:MAG TPA: M23 family metallopeptidase [Gaiellaceae bacterium]|nr:M23 family metallopeptidase [Gaiellaceae bacterium]